MDLMEMAATERAEMADFLELDATSLVAFLRSQLRPRGTTAARGGGVGLRSRPVPRQGAGGMRHRRGGAHGACRA